MPEPTPIDRAHDEREEVVLGVDTHKDLHVAAVLSGLGALLATRAFPTTTAGYRRLVAGRDRSAPCVGPEWSAPAPTERR